MNLTPELLSHATSLLKNALAFQYPADKVLSHYFRENKKIGQRERAFLAESIYAILRHLRSLEALCNSRANPRQLFLLYLNASCGYSLQSLESAIAKTDIQWLAAQARQLPQDTPLAVRMDLPDWLFESLQQQMDEASLIKLCQALNQSAPLDLRVNTLKANRDDVINQLNREGIVCQAGQYAPLSIRLAEKPALQKHPLFLSGAFEVQDEGSQLLCHLLDAKRGEMVADFCAGAGGKTLALGAMMRNTGRLYAFDIAEKRLAKLKPRLARSGLSNVHPVLIAHENDTKIKRLAGKFDRVLVDAPCSGLGTLRRNPDLKWRQTPATVEELQAKQANILTSSARLVKPGGRLVYATCSLLASENDAIVDAFLAKHPAFKVLSAQDLLAESKIKLETGERLRLDPIQHGCDGFFAVVMQRE